ncbi:Leucine-binding protein domain-containing protein [Frankia sp. AiPs1]|uniref:ABC transporter substrate-binding protein n=1 Tax=Frankia sp. AiPa1 TaxID=573492 RepID=UPI00202B53AA|nr:ABC transporter substrate-binding protein [Frankia sp. AiPa1]MCL9762142.1 ABC transporter substrate-binding protein [Frankia sp. AiPa1]
MKRLPTGARRLTVLLVALALAMAACSNAGGGDSTEKGGTAGPAPANGAPGVTAKTINFSMLATKTNNPTGACIYDCFAQGIEAYFAFRNSEGGVHGRQLKLSKKIDDQLGQNQQSALQIIAANDTFGTFSAAQLPTGWGDLAKAGVPQYVWAIQPAAMAGHDNIWGNSGITCLSCTARNYSYGAKLVGAKHIAALGYGISDSSRQCAQSVRDSIGLYAPETGQQVSYFNDTLAFGLPNGVGPEVSAMKRAGVDMIVSCFDLNGQKTLAQELKRQGLADVKILHPNTYDQKFVQEAGDLFEGDIVLVSFRPFEADPGDSALADFRKWMDRTGAKISEVAMIGWIDADIAYQGILAAGPSFTRQSVTDATNKIRNFTAGGLVPPIDWTRMHESATQDDPTSHGAAQECFSFVQVKQGKFHMVGGTAAKPFVCWSNKNRDWSDPTLSSFK